MARKGKAEKEENRGLMKKLSYQQSCPCFKAGKVFKEN